MRNNDNGLPLLLKSKSNSLISETPSLSSPFIGSSKIKISGFSIIACANPNRCFIPREYFPTCFYHWGSAPQFLLLFGFPLFRSLCVMTLSIQDFIRACIREKARCFNNRSNVFRKINIFSYNLSVNQHPPGIRVNKTAYCLYQYSFTRAVSSDNAMYFPVSNDIFIFEELDFPYMIYSHSLRK